MADKIKVLVVDDSALIRQMLTEMLARAPDIEVVGAARDPYDAREKIKALEPDVLTLDVEMPRMDGITFLRNLMRLRPMPVVMVSSLTEDGAEETLEALALGAVDFVTKPHLDQSRQLEAYVDEILDKVRAAAVAQVRPAPRKAPPRRAGAPMRTTERVVAIGASTGGIQAIQEVLVALPPNAPGTVVAQHIPGGFSAAFAQRVNGLCAVNVAEAEDKQRILPGHVYVAPGGWHLRVRREGARYFCALSQDAPVNRHRPSVDVLFHSVAEQVGRNAVGVLLTGMGADGAKGLGAIRAAGGRTIAQDQESSVVWGMPGEAVKAGAAEQVLPLGEIAAAVLEAAAAANQGG